MVDAARKLLDLLEPESRGELGLLVAVMAFGSVVEAAGIGLVVPYLDALTRPQRFLENEWAGPALRALGVTDRGGVLLVSSVALIAAYVVKNGYIGLMWHRVYGFLFEQQAALTRRLLRAYLAAPYTVHLERNTAESVRNVTTEADRVFSGAVHSALKVLAEGLVIAGLVAVLLWVHTAAAAVVLAGMAAMGWALTAAFRQRLNRIGEERSEHQREMIQTVHESLGAIKEARLLGREASFLERFDRSVKGLTDSLRQDHVLQHYPRILLETGAVVGMIGTGAALVFTGVDLLDAIPVLGVFGVAAVRLLPSVNRVVTRLNHLQYEVAAIDAVHDELTELEARTERETASGPAGPPIHLEREIRIRNLRYRYPAADGAALRGVSLRVPRGDFVGVVGPTGSGKTTLVNLLLGLLTPDDGRIAVDGRDIRENLSSWQARIGYIPQDTYLTDDTIRRNVAFGMPEKGIDGERVRAALESAQAAAFVDRLPEGARTVVGERGVRLSGGQRQRIAIARALYRNPEVLVLDEATSALDLDTERRLTDAVTALSGEKTILSITHRLHSVRRCDAVHVLRDGRRVGSGPYEELYRSNAVFRRMAEAQEEVR